MSKVYILRVLSHFIGHQPHLWNLLPILIQNAGPLPTVFVLTLEKPRHSWVEWNWPNTLPRVWSCNSETASSPLLVVRAITWQLWRFPAQTWRGKKSQTTERNKNDANVQRNGMCWVPDNFAALVPNSFLRHSSVPARGVHRAPCDPFYPKEWINTQEKYRLRMG